MKSSVFASVLPLLVAVMVCGGGVTSAFASSPDVANARSQQPLLSKISGGAVKERQHPTRAFPFRRKSFVSTTTATDYRVVPQTPRSVSFIPTEVKENNPKGLSAAWSKFRESSKPKNGLTLREQLTKKGMAAFLSYILLQNICSCSYMACAWYGFSVRTGVSPLFPGQWKPFLAVFASFVAMDAFMKPVRLAVSIAAAPLADNVMAWLEKKSFGSKSLAMVAAFAGIIASSLGFFAGGIALASSFSGVPIFAP